MTALAVYVFLLIIGGLAVATGLAAEAWWERRTQVGELEETNGQLETRNAELRADLDRARAGWADLRAQRDHLEGELARERRHRRADDQRITAWQQATADIQPRRSADREQERLDDLFKHEVDRFLRHLYPSAPEEFY